MEIAISYLFIKEFDPVLAILFKVKSPVERLLSDQFAVGLKEF